MLIKNVLAFLDIPFFLYASRSSRDLCESALVALAFLSASRHRPWRCSALVCALPSGNMLAEAMRRSGGVGAMGSQAQGHACLPDGNGPGGDANKPLLAQKGSAAPPSPAKPAPSNQDARAVRARRGAAWRLVVQWRAHPCGMTRKVKCLSELFKPSDSRYERLSDSPLHPSLMTLHILAKQSVLFSLR